MTLEIQLNPLSEAFPGSHFFPSLPTTVNLMVIIFLHVLILLTYVSESIKTYSISSPHSFLSETHFFSCGFEICTIVLRFIHASACAFVPFCFISAAHWIHTLQFIHLPEMDIEIVTFSQTQTVYYF